MENNNLLRYHDNFVVKQANDFLRSQQDELTLLETKLIRLAISQILIEDKDLRTYTCQLTDLAKYLGIPYQQVHRDVGNIVTSIMRKVIKIVDKESATKRNGKPNYIMFHWVDTFEYKDGTVTIKLSEELRPYLLGLSELFTEYEYRGIKDLPTPHAIRLYELLKSYESLVNIRAAGFTPSNPFPTIEKEDNELIFSIEYLKEFFGCQNKYAQTGDFIKKVIHASVLAINSHTDTMRISYRLVKEGRAFAYVLFKLNAYGQSDFDNFVMDTMEA